MASRKKSIGFTGSADTFDVMRRASLVRRRYHSAYLMPAHILVGIQDNEGNAGKILQEAGLKTSLQALAIRERMFEPYAEVQSCESVIPSPYVLSAMDRARGLAREQADGTVDTEHVLLGLLKADEFSDAPLLLALADMNLDRVIALAKSWNPSD